MSSKIYLPGLNGLRAIAAIAVIVSHINGSLELFKLPKQPYLDLAGFGVTIFFALSGFLITFLLLKENEKKGIINIPKFYMRRVLRIWPLYFLYLFIVFLCFGFEKIGNVGFLYLFILPNFVNIAIAEYGMTMPLGLAMFNLGHYWSLGVEEQFYVFWPWLIKKIKKLELFLIVFPVLFFIIKLILKFSDAPLEVGAFFHYSRFGCLAIGGLGAFYYHKNHYLINVCKNKYLELFAYLIILVITFNKFHLFSIIDHEIVTVITLIIIINQIDNPKRSINLENRFFGYLGKISFGLYVFNPIIITLNSKIFELFEINFLWLKIVLVYSSTVLLVILVSHISYFYFEKKFLNFKTKYITISSSASNPINDK